METRSDTLAAGLEQAVAEYLGVVGGLSQAAWGTLCPNEERTVAVLTRHVAEGIPFEMAVFRAIATGERPETITRAWLDALNAGHAAAWAECDQAATLALLRANAAAAADEVRGWSDAHLARTGKYIEDLPEPWTVEQWVARVLTGHVTSHLASIRAALG
ncbi:MAG TPA: DinB family protein [Thermomicrobiaceae bacterium]|nr:DinB family protein [Thermomicrobiaceae bacterium]